jgi:hypothetical protein
MIYPYITENYDILWQTGSKYTEYTDSNLNCYDLFQTTNYSKELFTEQEIYSNCLMERI